MKNLLVGFLLTLLTISCTSTLTEESAAPLKQTADLTFSVKSSDYSVDQNSFTTRASANDVLNTLDLALYTLDDGDYTLYARVQSDKATDGTLGVLSLSNVAYGTYYVVCTGHSSGYGGHVNLTDIHNLFYEEEKVPVTYSVYQTVTVNESTSNIALTLTPAVASFRLKMLGAIPSDVASVILTIQHASNYLDAPLKLASSSKIQTFTQTTEIPESAIGLAGQTVRINAFLPQEDMSGENSGIIITAQALDGDGGEIISYTFQNVPMRVGYITTYSGNFFQSDTLSFQIEVDNNWGSLSGTF